MTESHKLLKEYGETGSESAFHGLVMLATWPGSKFSAVKRKPGMFKHVASAAQGSNKPDRPRNWSLRGLVSCDRRKVGYKPVYVSLGVYFLNR